MAAGRRQQDRGGDQVRRSVVAILAANEPPALFAAELSSCVLPTDSGADEVEEALRRLARDGAVLVTTPPVPDPHLAAFDLRIVALVPPELPPEEGLAAATTATSVVWGRWLREFLASHRCQ